METRCSKCGRTHETEAFARINVKESPELKAKVKDGSLFLWECPSCGESNLARYQTIYHDPDEHLMIWLLPEGSLPKEQFDAIDSQMKAASEALEGYTFRRVGDVGSLIEKVNIFDAGLDDVVIEMCKYVTRMEMRGKKDAPQGNVSLKFYRFEGSDNDLLFSYPENGQMKALAVGFNVYEDCAGIVRRNPAMSPRTGFASIDPAWIEQFFKG